MTWWLIRKPPPHAIAKPTRKIPRSPGVPPTSLTERLSLFMSGSIAIHDSLGNGEARRRKRIHPTLSETKILFSLGSYSSGFEADGMEKKVESVGDFLVETVQLREAVLL